MRTIGEPHIEEGHPDSAIYTFPDESPPIPSGVRNATDVARSGFKGSCDPVLEPDPECKRRCERGIH